MNGRRFLYLRDPIFISVFALYWVNRWMIKPITLGHTGFFHSYFNDLLCIPFWLPPVLLVHRKLGIRRHDRPPTNFELVAHWAVWSIFFEVIGPRMRGLFPHTTADPWDVLAYAVGVGLAALLWKTQLLCCLKPGQA